jgi:hypothetical protein
LKILFICVITCREVNCRGIRSSQCISKDLVCNGFYDCLDRSDESGCSKFPIDETKSIQLNDCNVTEDNSITGLGHRGDPGFECGSKVCLPVKLWCQKSSNLEWINDTLLSLCPETIMSLKNPFLCKNYTFWKGKECAVKTRHRDFDVRCKGNSPGQCLYYENMAYLAGFCDKSFTTYQFMREKSRCEDRSDWICTFDKEKGDCEEENIYLCKNKEYCLPQDVVCDGYDHCGDGSDEDPGLCKVCPRDFGFPSEKVQRATFLCKHRYTGRWICAVPCDGEDDLCEDFEDENCKSSPFLTTILVTLMLLIVTIMVSEPIFRKQLHCILIENEILLTSFDDPLLKFAKACLLKLQFPPNKTIGKVISKYHHQEDYCKITQNLFLNDDFHIDKHIAGTFYKIELSHHNKNEIETLICIKKHVGTNKQAALLFHLCKPPSFFQKIVIALKISFGPELYQKTIPPTSCQFI